MQTDARKNPEQVGVYLPESTRVTKVVNGPIQRWFVPRSCKYLYSMDIRAVIYTQSDFVNITLGTTRIRQLRCQAECLPVGIDRQRLRTKAER